MGFHYEDAASPWRRGRHITRYSASALSIGQVDAPRKEKGQVVREVPMAVIIRSQLQPHYTELIGASV
jgi:hypothetical protein